MKNRDWGGSVLNFVVVGVTLVALLLVGAYVAKRYIAQNSSGEVAVNDSQNSSTDSSSDESDKPADSSKTRDDKKSSDSDQSEQPNTDSGVNGQAQDADNSDIPVAGGPSLDQLPQTGPADAVSVVGTASLLGAVAFYGASRRQG